MWDILFWKSPKGIMRVEIKITAGPAKGQHFTFDGSDRFLFGRAADARISLPNDPYVSRQHFLLEISPPDSKVTDLDSKNGLFVNGTRYGGRKPPRTGVMQAPNGAQSTYLKDGDEIVVGDTRMKVFILTDVLCIKCGKKIDQEEQDKSTFVSDTYLCSNCKRKEAIKTSLSEEIVPPSSAPKSGKRKIHCIRCNKDVTNEAGARGQVAGAEYVCKNCRKEETTGPLGLIEQMLNDAVAKKTPPDSPVIQSYHIEKEIGRGGMGLVYKATDERTGQPVAIKTMLPHVAANPDSVRVFQREIEVTRQLQHPNIVRLFDHGNAQGTFYFVLEFVDGIDLYQLIVSRGGYLSLDEAAPILLGTLEGLAYAHQASFKAEISEGEVKTFSGIVHRDLKPQNILLARRGNQWIPKISDFGTAKSFESAGFTDITVPGDVLGTPMYWPREQITHYKYLSPATDVFSLASVFYEMLTGVWVREGFQEMFDKCKQQRRLPSISDYMKVIAGNPAVPIRKRNPDIPEPVAKVFDRALREAEVPHDKTQMRKVLAQLRYPNARIFLNTLVSAFEEIGLSESTITVEAVPEQKPQPPPQEGPYQPIKDLKPSSIDAAIMYSIMQPSSSREVALFVLDLEKPSEYIQEIGDTSFSNLIGSIYRRIKKHHLASDLVFLKTTGDGFLAVFHRAQTAFSLASDFLKTQIHQDVSIRMALHWGTVKTGPDGDVLGAEVHRLFRIESVQEQDRIELAEHGEPLPSTERFLVTKQVVEQLDEAAKAKLRAAGKFQLKGFNEPCELWMLSI